MTSNSFAILCVLRVPHEEAMMRERFGEHFEAYCQKTGLWPKIME